VDLGVTQTSMVTFSSFDSTVFFKKDVFIFERSREIDWKKIDRPGIKPVSQQNKLKSGLLRALFACTNKATVRA